MESEYTPFFDRLDEYRETPPPPSDWHSGEETTENTAAVAPADLLANAKCMKSSYLRVSLGLFLFALVPQLLFTALTLILAFAAPTLLDNTLLMLLLSDGCMYLVGAPLCLLVMGMPRVKSRVLPQKMKPLGFLAAYLAFLCASIVGNLLGTGLMEVFSFLFGQDYSSAIDSALEGLGLLPIFLFVVVIAPIMEELIFRAAPLSRLLPFGEAPAIFFTALVFGLAHGNLYQFFYCFAGGLILGYLYARTRKLLWPILLHMLFNFTGGFLPTWIERACGLESTPAMIFTLMELVLATLGAVVLLLFFANRHLTLRPSELPLPQEGMNRLRFLNAGALTLYAALVLLMLLSFLPVS